MAADDERRLRRELAAARELAEHQLRKIDKLRKERDRLEHQLRRCRATVDELVTTSQTVD